MAPRYESIPKFSNDPEQDAEMRAEYFAECRFAGINPWYAGDSDDDYDPDAYDGEEDYDGQEDEDQ